MQEKADLHIHTLHSDGLYTTEQIFQKAKATGLRAISITDHDSIDGCLIAERICVKYKIEFITGIELSSYLNGQEYHILGYMVDTSSKLLQEYLAIFKEARLLRAKKILEKLNKNRIPLSFDAVLEKAGDAPIARPHIASAMVEMGTIRSLKEAFILYLGEGRLAYEAKHQFPVKDAIKLINQCGGIAVLAHPAKMINQDDLFTIIEDGLDGIEVIHPIHDNRTERFYRDICSQYCLLETGGSDYHGSREYDEKNFGKYVIPYSVVESIKLHNQRK